MVKQIGSTREATRGEHREDAFVAERTLDIAPGAVAKISTTAASQVAGLNLSPKAPGLFDRLYRTSRGGEIATGHGITIRITRNREVCVRLSMSADYGVHIPSAVSEVRRLVAENISTMTDFPTSEINIRIVDVVVRQEPTEATLAWEERK